MIIYIITILFIVLGLGSYTVYVGNKNKKTKNNEILPKPPGKQNCISHTDCTFFQKKDPVTGLYERCAADQTNTTKKVCIPCESEKRGPDCEFFTTKKQCDGHGVPGEDGIESWDKCTCDPGYYNLTPGKTDCKGKMTETLRRELCNKHGTFIGKYPTDPNGKCICDKVENTNTFEYLGDKCQFKAECNFENTSSTKLNKNRNGVDCVCKNNFYGPKCNVNDENFRAMQCNYNGRLIKKGEKYWKYDYAKGEKSKTKVEYDADACYCNTFAWAGEKCNVNTGCIDKNSKSIRKTESGYTCECKDKKYVPNTCFGWNVN